MDKRAVLPIAVGALAVTAAIWFLKKSAKPKIFLNKEKKKVKIIDIKELSHDVKRYRLGLGDSSTILGLPVGKHIVIHLPNPQDCITSKKWNGKDDPDKGALHIERKYTPTTGDEQPGYVDLVIKTYRPGTVKMPDGKEMKWDNGGKASLFLDSKKVGDELEINGPIGVNEYQGKGTFKLPGRTVTVKKIGMMAGGTGLTPMLQVAAAIMKDPEDTSTVSLLYANKTEDDILCKDLLDELVASSSGRFKVHYTLDFPPANWTGKTGFITQDMIKETLPGPGAETLILMCGPPPMIEFACKKNLDALGYDKKAQVNF